MSSATEDAVQIRAMILELFSHAGEGDFKPENAHLFEDDDLEIHKGAHALFAFSMFKKLPGGMVGQDSGQPWFLYWLTNALEVANYEQIALSAQ